MIIFGVLTTIFLVSLLGMALYGLAYNNMAVVIWLAGLITAIIQIATGVFSVIYCGKPEKAKFLMVLSILSIIVIVLLTLKFFIMYAIIMFFYLITLLLCLVGAFKNKYKWRMPTTTISIIIFASVILIALYRIFDLYRLLGV